MIAGQSARSDREWLVHLKIGFNLKPLVRGRKSQLYPSGSASRKGRVFAVFWWKLYVTRILSWRGWRAANEVLNPPPPPSSSSSSSTSFTSSTSSSSSSQPSLMLRPALQIFSAIQHSNTESELPGHGNFPQIEMSVLCLEKYVKEVLAKSTDFLAYFICHRVNHTRFKRWWCATLWPRITVINE